MKIDNILESIKSMSKTQRIEYLCELFLGLPYISNPITDSKEALLRLDGFDCVTFVETVLAISMSQTADEAPKNVEQIRYQTLSFQGRNHFTSIDWLPNNIELFDIVGADSQVNIWIDHEEFFTKNNTKRPEDIPRKSYVSFPYTSQIELSKLSETPHIVLFIGNRDWIVVDHLGILLPKKRIFYHASSEHEKVVKVDIHQYIHCRSQKLGITILRLK